MADETTIDGGLVDSFLAPLSGMFISPLEAIVAAADYWLLCGVHGERSWTEVENQ